MGKMSRDKGAAWEKHLAAALRSQFPGLVRAVRTGSAAAADPGDLAGTDFIVWSAKNTVTAAKEQPAEYRAWFGELATMVAASPRKPRPVGVLVVKRHGYTEVGMAWCWMTLDDLHRIILDEYGPRYVLDQLTPGVPVRLALADILPTLVAWEQRWTERAA